MDRVKLRWIIGLMSIALIGLVTFQLYWIDTVIKANEERFKGDVISALHTVSTKLEKQEAYSALQQRLSLGNPNLGTSNGFQHGGGGTFQLNINDSLGVIQDLSFSLSISQGGSYEFSQLPQGNVPSDMPAEDLQKISNKSQTMMSVLQEFMFQQRPIQSRLSPEALDSLIAFELGENGIDIDYDFGVISPYQNQFVYLTNRDKSNELASSELRASLFPNDLTGDYDLLVVDFPGKSRFLRGKIWFTMGSSGLLMAVILFCFAYAIRTILHQKKLSELKNDFINNMTHELKTPIATVRLAVEALQDSDLKQQETIRDRYLGMIQEENHRLGQHVENVLRMGALERKDLKMKMEVVDFHDLVSLATRKIELQVENNQGTLKSILNAQHYSVKGDPAHLVNVILNLLDNANKYSPEKPNIIVRTEESGSDIVLSVQDHGLGMSKEAARQIFQKFYRVPTGNVHNVKGFGLGLAYVKSVVEEHHGTISVQTELGKGSKFFISLPIYHGEA